MNWNDWPRLIYFLYGFLSGIGVSITALLLIGHWMTRDEPPSYPSGRRFRD